MVVSTKYENGILDTMIIFSNPAEIKNVFNMFSGVNILKKIIAKTLKRFHRIQNHNIMYTQCSTPASPTLIRFSFILRYTGFSFISHKLNLHL